VTTVRRGLRAAPRDNNPEGVEMELFAQQRGGAPPGPDAGVLVGVFMFYGVLILIAIIIRVFFLLSMSKCFRQISPRNRQMEPGMVWLALIPIFDIVWIIIMVIRLSDSLRDEFYDRGLREDGDFGKMLGILYIVFAIVCGPVGLICFIMYWVKVAGYTKQLAARRRYADDDDEEDDRPRRRRRRDEDEDDDDERPRRR
jgi:hypothetical protein